VDAETSDAVETAPAGADRAGGAAARATRASVVETVTEGESRRAGGRLPRLRLSLELLLRFQTVFGLAGVVVAGVLLSPRVDGQNVFLTVDNLVSIVRSVSEYGILAVGMTFVIIAAGIDLSVGALLGFSGILLATLMVSRGWGMLPAVAAVLLMGALFGLAQGVISTTLKIQPFIITLAGLQLALGLGEIISGNKHIAIVSGHGPGLVPTQFDVLGGQVAGTVVPVSVTIFLAVAAAGALVLNTTRFGQHVFAVGGNARAARLSGINVRAVITGTFVICGFTAALGGVVDAGQYHFAGSNQGAGFELTVIAAVVIGGTNLMGGTGSIFGTVAGALLLGTLRNILILNNVDPNKQPVITAIIIVIAVALQNLASRRSSP
jgi:ribose transport system permease protein